MGARVCALALAWAGAAQGQSTWQTTHTTENGWNGGACELMHATLRVTVHPAWLDVEEDLEMAAVGSVSPGNDPKTLEITGEFRLPQAAAITGALLWDGDKVLQGRLLDKAKADSLYQSLVDRNSLPPARPRDPILLERVSPGAYRMRIYPVEISRSRHVRLRYQLPPRLGAEGLQTGLQAAVASLFPGNQSLVSVSFEGGGVERVVLATPDGGRSTLGLPRTRLMRPSDLDGGTYDPYFWYHSTGTVLFPVDPLRQVSVRTSIASGLMAGHYLNLYAGVTDEVLGALGRKVEVVVLWKWHAPGTWLQEDQYGYVNAAHVYAAQSQAAALLDLYGRLGGPGSRIGLLHDDGKGEPKRFKAASRGESGYADALDYLGHLQGNYVEEFARSMKPATRPKPGDQRPAIVASKNRFYQNLRLVKTLYSPATGVVRHLLLVSAGPENITSDAEGNAFFDSLFADEPLSVGTLPGSAFAQAGFDAWTAHRDHPDRGPRIATAYGSLPGFEALNLNLTVRNDKKAYDFPFRCEGGLNLSCGSLTFHGKSDSPWRDSLEWEAFDMAGGRIGSAKSRPVSVGVPEDTAIAILWAGSEAPFSENRNELPLGPVYGFVDRWASLVGVPKDTLPGAQTYADTGVPRLATARLADVLPNYQPGQAPEGPIGGPITGLAARTGALEDPGRWSLVRERSGFILRIPGLAAGLEAQVQLFDLAGKRAGAWAPRSEEGALNLSAADVRPGIYLLKVRIGNQAMAKRIAF
jgi:hypothetical protein